MAYLVLYSLTLISLFLYSFTLVDLNLTFFNHPFWELFREKVIYIGWFRRDLSWILYLVLILLLFLFNWFFTNRYKKFNPMIIALLVSIALLMSYPFLSHDFFNYLFDARILTFYHKSPYLFTALDFPADAWTRFMHWTHRTYPYGPTFLIISLIPSFLAGSKFILNYFSFKLMFFLFYFLAVYALNKLNKKWAIFFATHPLVIVEGLINSHNDLIGVCLSILGGYFILKNQNLKGRAIFLFSAGIKYITAPFVFLSKNNKSINTIIFALACLVLVYLKITSAFHAWYALSLLVFIPFFPNLISKLNIFFIGLLMSYYPYIRIGEWSSQIEDTIIFWFLIINVIYLAVPVIWSRIKLTRR
ncbi:hypothetical protein COT62_03170 [Candidatus Roizmanbacteria bacterium CG09_land_8_20_14_0_10_41_9]|uniref:DUF2029 domain-containing protein n=1 Tax=Candidatus Roizmanbacteria bacterium CG09_land_8_20_14_0_10_41_9 TaxID=1974850 RepID=A0A2H0WS94_9BACT|nr:MAG: hypothetical protein COT62_03170 [Candidatus Roizmanbacteria bacterium CG09_land_8_20_14_0_10_41_9]